MRTRLLLFVCPVLALALAGLGPGRAAAEEGAAPTPRLDRVDYAKPAEQRSVGPALGVGQRSRGIAKQIAGAHKEPLVGIVRWVDRNLKTDPLMSGRWRGVDQILKDGTLGGVSDRAVVIGALARIAGIPAVWVKTLPTKWLAAARLGRAQAGNAPGHVFLEVHDGKAWRLLDPVTARLYEDYDPRSVNLPAGQRAFDKGADPHALVLPNRPELFDKQARGYARRFDPGRLPWARSRDLLARWRVYVAGKGGNASHARATAKAFGFKVEKCFNTNWEHELAAARGKTLIVVVDSGGVPALPKKYRAELLPKGYGEILSGAKTPPKGWVAHTLKDGTRVILVVVNGYGPVELAVAEALES